MQKNIMNQFYTAESVTEGHPDKLCDLIADSVLDECLSHDALSRVACEVLATKGQIIVAGEITSLFEPDITQIAHSVLRKVGYDPTRFAVQCLIHKQSSDIAAGVDCSLERRRNLGENHSAVLLGAGDQGVMVGYACSETPQMMPLPVVLAHRLTGTLTFARKSGMIQGLRPDGKAQVTVEYDENGKPLRLDTIVLSAQHSPKKPIDELYWELTDKVLPPALQAMPPDEDTKILLNPSGRFVLDWEEERPQFVLQNKGDNSVQRRDAIGQFSFSVGPKQHCVGNRDMVDHHPMGCPDGRDVIGNHQKCEKCERNDLLKFCARCTGNKCFITHPMILERCAQEHVIYLAYFPPDTVKIGVAHGRRKYVRLYEQGALCALLVFSCPDGKTARRFESLIHRTGIKDKIPRVLNRTVRPLPGRISMGCFLSKRKA